MGGTASATQMKTMFDNVIDVMEQFIDMPEFDEHFNPGKVRDMVDMIPGLGDNEEVLAALSSPQFQDKELLKVTVREGLRSLREYTGQLAEMLTNPQALEGLISNLPPDMQNMIRGVLNGDMSGVKQMLASVPGMNPATVEMVSKMLDGDMSSMVDNLQSILCNPENVEQSRQHLLKNPEMAEAMGIPAEVLHDQEKWEALVDEGKTQLGDNMGEGKESGGAFAEHPNAM